MTTTAAISAQSVGTSTNVGEGKFPQKVTTTGYSDRFYIEGKITNGAGSYSPANKVRIWYSSYSASITAAAAVDLLRANARYLDLTPSPDGSIARSQISLCEPLSGLYIYLWVDIPTQTVAQTLDVNVIEGP